LNVFIKLSFEEANEAAQCTSGFVSAATIDFVLRWLEGLEGATDDALFGSLVSHLVLQRRHMQSSLIATGLRPFPVTGVTPEEQRAMLKLIPLEEYVISIAPRLLALAQADFPFAVGVIGHRHEHVEAGIDVEIPPVHAVAADRLLQIVLAVRRAFGLVAVAPHVHVLGAVAAAAIVLAGQILVDLPHLAREIGIERVRRGEFVAQVDGAAAQHREQLARIVAVEGNEIGDLLALALGHLESLALLDLEADIAGRSERDRHAGRDNGAGFVHGMILRRS